MAALVLGGVALATVILSFALAALTLTAQQRERASAPEDPAETMSRVIADIERLAVLRDRGALTAKEFTTQKQKLLGTARAQS